MSTRLGADSFAQRAPTTTRPIGVYGMAMAMAIGMCGVTLVVSAVFAASDSVLDALSMAILGSLSLVIGVLGVRRPFRASTMRAVPTLSAAMAGFITIAAISTLVYLATGTFDRVDDALYESIAGVSTSALTLMDDPQTASRGLLVWRAGTQWMGGLGALTLAVGVLPFVGGSRELADPHAGRSDRRSLASRPVAAVRRVATIYAIVTAAVCVTFLLVGMGLDDAVAHALSSVSTGGFSTHAESIAFFDSQAVEIAMMVVMAGAGSSVALVWMIWRGQWQDTRKAFELQVYFAVIAIATLWVWWLQHAGFDSRWDGLRKSAFTVISLITTTGHSVADWGSWHPGAVTLLLVLLVVGGTAGSVAGGFRWIRVIGLTQFLWREMQRQLHPRSVRLVKVGTATMSEPTVDRMHAQLVYLMVAGPGAAIILALFGEEVVQAMTLALSALSTTGPGFDDGTTIATAVGLSRPERAVLMPVMLTGRVFLFPAIIAAGGAASAIARGARPLRTALRGRR